MNGRDRLGIGALDAGSLMKSIFCEMNRTGGMMSCVWVWDGTTAYITCRGGYEQEAGLNSRRGKSRERAR